MSISIKLYRTLDDPDMIGYIASEYEFGYGKDGVDRSLISEISEPYGSTKNTIILSDKCCEWQHDLYDIRFSRHIEIQTPTVLFGKRGVAQEDSVIGIALLWMSKTSNQRGFKIIGDINANGGKRKYVVNGRIPPGQIRGHVEFQTVLYLKICRSKAAGYADVEGTILCTLDTYDIIIDGAGSEFPIVEVTEPSQPLWYVKCDWTDPLSDPFDEDNVCICINSAHPSYPLLRMDEGISGSPYLTEVLAAAMQTIVQKAANCKDFNKILSGEDVEQGSIAQAINYFITTFGWDCSSPERLALTVRADLEKRL